MSFVLDTRPLTGCKPQLIDVLSHAATLCPISFKVVQGLRSRQQAIDNFRKGRTAAELKAVGITEPPLPGPKVTWVSSPFKTKHLDGSAADIAAVVNGAIDWTHLSSYHTIRDAVFTAAKSLNTKLRWGGDWDGDGVTERGEDDFGHFELL